jgi:hypothetical protein
MESKSFDIACEALPGAVWTAANSRPAAGLV